MNDPTRPEGEMLERKPKLEVREVSKNYRMRGSQNPAESRVPVLHEVSFEVYESEVVSLIGESGCGKTTLLRIIQGLIPDYQGTILVDGQRVTGPGRDRGFVFQHAGLLPWRSALSNVEFGLELQGVDARARAEKSQALLSLVGLDGAGDRFPHQLSGGMQQRIGLARALAINPAVLLMDEPFSALDAQTREDLQGELLRIHAETNKTIVFVTHDLDEAILLSHRVIVLGARPGRVKQIIDIPFAHPRPDLATLQGEPGFREVRLRMAELIRRSSVEAAPEER